MSNFARLFCTVISFCFINVGETTSELHFWSMFPWRLVNDVAFEECVDVGLLTNSTQHDNILKNYTYFFHNINSQCNITQGISHFYAEPPRLLVVSGGCRTSSKYHVSPDFLHISSQRYDGINTPNTLSVDLWLGSGSPGLSEYLASHQISLVSLIHQSGAYYEKIVLTITEHLKRYNIQTSPLLLSGHTINDVMRIETNFIRHAVLITDNDVLFDLLCQIYQRPTLPHVISIFTDKSTCDTLSNLICDGVSEWSVQDITCFGVLSKANNLANYCSFAYDALMTTLHAINGSNQEVINSFLLSRGTRAELNIELWNSIKTIRFIGKTGYVSFSELGVRVADVNACRLQRDGCYRIETRSKAARLGDLGVVDTIPFTEIEVELPSVIYLCTVTCAGLMALLALMLLVCNVKYRNNRILKLTSPNLTIVQLLGSMVTLSAIPVLGMKYEIFIYQLSIGLFTFGYTLQYGSFIVKQWRVYIIFKSLQPKRKPIKDELLLLVIIGLVSVDAVILTTWWILDPIQCHKIRLIPSYQKLSDSYVIESFNTFTSKLIWMWIGVIYFSKLLLMMSGIYLAYKTRHVSSPPLRDSRSVTTCCYLTSCLGLVVLPLVGSDAIEFNMKYTILSIVVFVTTGHAILLLVLPKMLIMQQMTNTENSRQESLRFDSSLKLSENSNRPIWCCCWSRDVLNKKPEYGESLLVGELETLRSTLKEKEARIRELNDRLYFGCDNFRAYISNGNKRVQTMRTKVGKNVDKRNNRRATVGDVRPGDIQELNWQMSAQHIEGDEEEGFGNAGFDDNSERYERIRSFEKFCLAKDENKKSMGDGYDVESDRIHNCSPLESGIGMDDRYEVDFTSCHEIHTKERRSKSPSTINKQLESNNCDKIKTVSENVDKRRNLGKETSPPTPRNDSSEISILQPSPVIERKNVAYAHRRLTNTPVEGKSKKSEIGRGDYIEHKKYIQYI